MLYSQEHALEAYNHVQEKGGRVQKSSDMVIARVPLPQAGEQGARKTEVADQAILQGISSNRLYPAFLYQGKKTHVFLLCLSLDAAPKMTSHQ